MTAPIALRSALAFLAAVLLSTAAHAQLFRAYVSSTGNDANPCTLPQPCRLLPAALTAVASEGEIWMLDSANYNTATVTIGKSVSILAVPGAVGSVLAIAGPAISITASGLSVSLRNLVIAPLLGSGGTQGISMTGASALTIENCLIAKLPDRGIRVVGTGTLNVVNTTLRENGSWAIDVQAGATATVSGTQALANSGGIIAYTSTAAITRIAISDSVISGGSHGAIAQVTVAGAASFISVTRSTIERTTGYALFSRTEGAGAAVVAVSASMLANNAGTWGIFNSGATIYTTGNNHQSGNSGSNTGSLTSLAPL